MASPDVLASLPINGATVVGNDTKYAGFLPILNNQGRLDNSVLPGGSGSGTVTSVALTLPNWFAVTGSPVTTNGTLVATANTSNPLPAYNGAALTNLSGANITATTVPVSALNVTGTASNTTYLRGDGTWAAVTSGGSVTSVGLTAPNWLSVSNSPITNSGNIALAANTANPLPAFDGSALINLTPLNIAWNFTSNITAATISAATKVSASTVECAALNDQNDVTAVSPNSRTLNNSVGTALTGIIAQDNSGWRTAVIGDFPTLNQNTTGTASNITGVVAVVHGGTGLSSLGTLPAFNGSALTSLAGANITGSSIPISAFNVTGTASSTTYLRGDGTWATPAANPGTVTSVAQTVPAGFSVSGSPITGAGTLAISYATGQTANQFLATPNGSIGALGLRAIVAADIPTLNQSTTGNAATVTGLSIVTGKTLTSSNTLTLVGTDGSSLNVGTGGTLGTAAFTAASAYEVPLTFSTGLTRSTNTVTVNASQNISTLSNLTTNGFVKTSGGTGVLSIDTTTYLTPTGNGSGLTNLSGANITATTVPITALNVTGTPSSSTYLRGDGTWASTGAGSGTVTSVDMTVPNWLSISGNPVTTSGTLALTANTANALPAYSGANLTSLNGSNISTGTVADARIAATLARLASPALTGTPTAPTAAITTSTTQLATTAFVNGTNPPVRTIKTQIFISSGTYTPSTGMVFAEVDVIGGGGAGGGITTTTSGTSAGGGGQAGSRSQSIFTASDVGASQTITVGSGGGGVLAGKGGSGGASSFGTLGVAGGGEGGTQSSASSTIVIAAGGSSGTATAGTLLTSGTYGTPGFKFSTFYATGGQGAPSPYGQGGAASFCSSTTTGIFDGIAGIGYGSGGSGACSFTTSTAMTKAGGSGVGGIIVVTEYCTQ